MCDMKDVPLSADSTGLGIGMNVAFNVVQCMDSVLLEVKSTNTFTYFQFVLHEENTDSVESSSRSDSPTWEISSIEFSKIRGKFF